MTDDTRSQKKAFEADVSRLLHMMVHSVYSDKSIFLRELISNAADACEKLRYEAIARPELLGDEPATRILVTLDPAARTLSVEDNGVGMSADDMTEALGTIARSGTRAWMEGLAQAGAEAEETGKAHLIGQFGVGFYSAFMVAGQVDVFSRKAGSDEAARWSSDGQGEFTVTAIDIADVPARGTRVVLSLLPDADEWLDAGHVRREIQNQSGHVPVPVLLSAPPAETGLDADANADGNNEDEPKAPETVQVVDGSALWTRPRQDITSEQYAEFYHSIGGMFDEPASTIHFRAEGRQEFTALLFTPSTRPFDLLDPERKGRVKLYVKRVFITDDAEILPRYLRFVRGVVDSSDLPLNLSREMIQNSPTLRAISQSVTSRVLGDFEKLAASEPEAWNKIWENFGHVIKEGVYEDFARQERLLDLARFRSTSHAELTRSIKAYVADMRENQTAIYYITGDDAERLRKSPHLEGYRARGIEVLLLTDPVDSFWVTSAQGFDGKPLRSVTQGAADLDLIPLLDDATAPATDVPETVAGFIASVKETLGDQVSDVRASSRLTDSLVCLVATGGAYDRHMERLLAGSGRLEAAARPVLEINPHHPLVAALAGGKADDAGLRSDIAHLLYDEAAVLDGAPVADPEAFAARLTRLMSRVIGA